MKKIIKILVSLPEPLHRQLMTLRNEGYTASGYIAFLLQNDFRARKETGWVAGKGWIPREEWLARHTPAPKPLSLKPIKKRQKGR